MVPRPDPQSLEPALGCSGFVIGLRLGDRRRTVGFSIATDTGGSIIHPSMRCGTVGMRPTYGR